MRPSICALTFMLVSSAAAADNWCSHEAQRAARIDAAGAKKVVIQTGAGDLKVRGNASQASVIVEGRACASSDELLQGSQLEGRRSGDVLYLKTVLPEISGGFLGFSRYARMDVSVTLPSSLPVELEDSSGDVDLQNLASTQVTDGSGDLGIRNITDDLKVIDNSGDVEIERVSGNVSITDSSGDLEIEHVRGIVEVTVDSSGDIRIADAGSVHIGSDSSGEISIERVNANVQIDTDSSGDIVAEQISGNFTVGHDGSGDIRHANVVGKVQLPAGKSSDD
jgi:hypothetical protein